MEKIKIGQIGIGHNHGEEKMKSARRLPNEFEIVGVAEPDEAWLKARGHQEGYRGLPFMSVEELLATPGLQAVLVESDVKDLMKTARLCIDRGLHIHLDKPVGTDLEAYRGLLRDAKRQNLVVQLGYMYRYNPAVRDCLRRAKAGELGEIYHMDTHMSTEHWPEYRQWLSTFPSGTMYIFGCHMIDMIVHVMGAPENVVSFCNETGKGGISVVDNCVAALTYPKGTSLVRTSSVEINGFGRRQVVVCGENGTIEVKPLENPMCYSISRPDSNSIFQDHHSCQGFSSPAGRYDDQLREFAQIIRGQADNPYPWEHEYLVQLVSLAACGVIPYEKPAADFEL